MKLSIKNLGKISNCEFELNDLTILVGDNNSGKTYVTYTTYGVLKNWRDFLNPNVSAEIARILMSKGEITIEKEKILAMFDFAASGHRYQLNVKRIRDLFNDKEQLFFNTEVELNYEIPESFKSSSGGIRMGDSVTIEGKMSQNKLTLTYTQTTDSFVTDSSVGRLATELINNIVFSGVFPEPYIFTAERLGISLFYKELDERRNTMIEGLQKLEKRDEKFHLFELISSMSAYYATPIRDHIAFTRNIENIVKRNSKIDSTYTLEILKKILGAEFKKESKKDIRLHTKNKKLNKFDIPLYLASSSTRCLADLYFYIKHLAKPGDLVIIDEPESHLTLKNQRLLAKLFVAMIKTGLKIFITTHSDFLVKELNNLIMLGNDFEGKIEFLKSFKDCYSENDSLSSDRVSVYLAEDGTLHKLPVTNRGISIPYFDKEINNIFNIAAELDFLMES